MKLTALRMFQFAFGCHHRQISRVATIKKRTYQVCFRCGQEFAYSSLLGGARANHTADHQPSPAQTL